MKTCGELISEQKIMEKILLRLTPQFDHIVVAIDESKDLEELKVEEPQNSLEAHEQRLNEKSSVRELDQAMQAQTFKKGDADNRDWKKGKGKGKGNWSSNKETIKVEDKSESSNKRRGRTFNNQRRRKGQDKKKIQCFNCEKWGRYASECWHGKGKQTKNSEEKANVAQDEVSDEDLVLLVATSDGTPHSEAWYLDIGCSNHMTDHKEWLSDFDASRRLKIRLANSRTLAAEGKGNIVIQRKYGKATLIENVLFVPGMKCNLGSVRQLVEKGFSIITKHDFWKLFDTNQKPVLKSPLSKNRTFQANIRATEVHCLIATELN